MLSLACLSLVVFASSVQAAHIHGQWLPHHDVQATAPANASQLPGGEEHCPLCVAMHSAMPAATVPSIDLVAVTTLRVPAQVEHAPESHWHYARFSRPPPAVKLSQLA